MRIAQVRIGTADAPRLAQPLREHTAVDQQALTSGRSPLVLIRKRQIRNNLGRHTDLTQRSLTQHVAHEYAREQGRIGIEPHIVLPHRIDQKTGHAMLPTIPRQCPITQGQRRIIVHGAFAIDQTDICSANVTLQLLICLPVMGHGAGAQNLHASLLGQRVDLLHHQMAAVVTFRRRVVEQQRLQPCLATSQT